MGLSKWSATTRKRQRWAAGADVDAALTKSLVMDESGVSIFMRAAHGLMIALPVADAFGSFKRVGHTIPSGLGSETWVCVVCC